MYLKKGDKVVVLSGKEKGKVGTIKTTIKEGNRVIIDGINVGKKHVKANANNQTGGIMDIELPIHASNVALVDPKTKKATRIGHTTDKNGKKVRVSKKSKEVFN